MSTTTQVTATQLAQAYNEFCDLVNPDTVRKLITSADDLTVHEQVIIHIFAKAQQTGVAPSFEVFEVAAQGLNG